MKFKSHLEMILSDIEETHYGIKQCAEVAGEMLTDRACEPVSDFVRNDNMLGGLLSAIAQLSERSTDLVSKLCVHSDIAVVENGSIVPIRKKRVA